MTTDLAAALLRDVPTRYQPVNGDRLLHESDVLAALSAHLDADLAERAGEAIESLRLWNRDDAADLITALLAQNAALRAERDSLLRGHRTLNVSGAKLEDRLTAAEARTERLEAVLQKIADMPDYRLPKPQDIARAALTTEADNG
jgi:formate dehydrogenase maturation protein FdhE